MNLLIKAQIGLKIQNVGWVLNGKLPVHKEAIDKDIEAVKEWGDRNNRPMYMGEFGAYSRADLILISMDRIYGKGNGAESNIIHIGSSARLELGSKS